MRKLIILVLCLAIIVSSFLFETRSSLAESAATAAIVINEIHYDPAAKTAHLEFTELYNAGAQPVDLTGWSLTKAVDFVFPPGTVLANGGYLVVAQNPTNIKAAYNVGALGPVRGKLANEGDEVLLRDRDGKPVDVVDYRMGFPWPIPSANADQSIGLINPALDNGLAAAWRSGYPTPGRSNTNLIGNPPPFVNSVEHVPFAPQSTDRVTIRAHVTDSDGVATVRAFLQPVVPGQYLSIGNPAYATYWASVTMQPIGNDIFAAEVPASMVRNRNLVRYRVEAVDGGGRSVTTPYSDDPQPNFAFFVYDGTPSWSAAIQPNADGEGGQGRTQYDFKAMRPLPVYHLIADQMDVANAQYIPPSGYLSGYMGSGYPWSGTFVVDGVVYDHIGFRARGGGFRYSVGKNNWKFNFHRGHSFQGYDNYGVPYPVKWDKLNFSSVTQHNNRKYRGEQGMFETLAYRLFNLAGVPAPDTHFVHFRVIDQASEMTANQYEGDFWGLYLAIQNLDGRLLEQHALPDGNLYDMHDFTGSLENQGESGVFDGSDLRTFIWLYTTRLMDPGWWQATFDLQGYFKFRSILEAVHHYDVDQGKNYDYYLNPETGKWSILPWDLDLTFAETMFGEGNEPFRDRVLSNPTFNVAYQNHLREMRDLLFSPEQMVPMINEVVAVIDGTSGAKSMVDADRAMWDYNPILASRYVVSTRAAQGRYYAISPANDFAGMVQLLIDYVGRRSGWIDQVLLTDRAHPVTPAIAYTGPGGYPADQLSFQASAFADPQGANTFSAMQWRAAELVRADLPGYTAGTRPHYEAEATWVSPELTTYTAHMTVPSGSCRPGLTCRVRVRMRDNTGRWSHWSPAIEFVPGAPQRAGTTDLRISEIMYRPAPSDTLPGEDLEFLELQNVGSATVDLSNMHFTAGIEYTFPAGAALQPGAQLVLAKDEIYFKARYGFVPFGVYDKELSNKGERISLVDAFGASVLDVTYGDEGGWPDSADGYGPSIVPTTLAGDANSASNWRASTLSGGSPGASDPLPVVINELAMDNATGALATVELYNPSEQDADVSGWLLSTVQTTLPARLGDIPAGLRLPAGSTIPAGGYLALPALSSKAPLAVAAGGGAVALFSAAQDGTLSGYVNRATFGIAPAGTTLGRVVTSDARTYFVAQVASSLGSANSGPQIGPVVIRGLMLDASNGMQWIELANTSNVPANLYDPADLRRPWMVGGVVFQFPAGITLPVGGHLLLTNQEPAEVCLAGRVPQGMRVVGPFALRMNTQEIDVNLMAPTAWGAGDWAPVVVDGVHYRAVAPWPTPGVDVALQRINLAGIGNEPANWQANADWFGEPSNLVPAIGDVCSFDVYVNDDGQMEIRWVATLLASTDSYRLLRSSLDNLAQSEIIATQAVEVDPSANTPAQYRMIDPAADPDGAYLYRLQIVAGDETVTELAITTPRVPVHLLRAPAIYR